ncbi:MAG: hypothetical protein A3C80_01820 [Candidatus Ryanbacteria bacterium RIFCSPHIGHO2_02_FULL_45_43]|uniref:Penicillin-binding protein transpeptidase domain-containing protein n=1 Tax=Candidatus Ryanbacteria bacterium RIFCSPHIGHO2_01_45_13 TaxID=1802112 RepID=A0A1G2FYQ6_9BACT|nr:MAG: hypothetical protein A2718_02655 [Candidatus Ryanbacteria bacterium RIFCSPHIGHO2_01_FULL_44_130]OGZ42977.1 MAG: hypothetical protein A2W41_02595 [Candidatus Ryanbacteria bacterium RIFCSPHIGHO2_01_45_13]OGZ48682.1 MAG: hypothetical protein A3C80_01820 [Candidatus Ryanbacteria bacterium RIFCSPHIGHO2_02_FULL_45_43]OGZ50622.1 MAG: hypothetical protein A3E55_03300 [Candidatus Ryanbacteria bacterium RIFCSPHIGHO2_12_FULL_44_20]OGZ51928.1 MAG: hypothetical protein A3A17_00675 [Candidatus Ryanba
MRPARINIIQWIFLLVFVVILGRLVYLQVLHKEQYKALSHNQQQEQHSPLKERGRIYFQSKDALFLAATEKPFYVLAINARAVKDPDRVYAHLSNFFKIDKDVFYKKALKDDPFEIILRRVNAETKALVEKDAPEGIVFITENLRYYPGESLAAHVLGFVGSGEEGMKGRYGVEQYYDSLLSMNGSALNMSRNNGGIASFFKNPITYKSGGGDLILTIDIAVQTTAEYILEQTLQKWESERGGIIVLNPTTGRIIAMAAYPTYNPNEYYDTENVGVFVNPLTQHIFEMGSVFKPITIAAGIDKGVITPDTTYFDAGKIEIDDYIIKNFDAKGRGYIDIRQVLLNSLNTGAVFVAQALGKETFREYVRAFGLGEKTGIDLMGEVAGNIQNLNSPRSIEYATASFGQGISVSPIGITMALSAVANGGNLLKPYVVEKIQTPEDKTHHSSMEIKRRVISEEAARTVTRMMVDIVDEKLYDGKAAIPGYSVAAKTGTAQVPLKESRGYSEDFIHSFVGFAPAFDPHVFIYMYIERPVGVRYASQSLTEPFRELMQFVLSYYEIPPDRL